MPVKFTTVSKKNPQDLTAPEKYYANAIGDGEVGIEKLAKLISQNCTVTEADCLAVLASLERQMMNQLEDGRIVRLEKIGTFQIGISSKGLETQDEVTSSAITKTRLRFRPSKTLRTFLKTLSFNKAA
ncbi:MAG: HU family DNA-binding protein [Flavobacteriales bacterium]|nr:HU family DNA-binding protein [Flavobacteriales bacterium]